MKRTLRLAALTVLAALILCGCNVADVQAGGEPAAGTLDGMPVLVGDRPVEMPLAEDGAALNILMSTYDGMDPETVFVWKTYEEMTGVDVRWTAVTKETRAEAVHTALTNNRSVDLILRCKLSANKLMQYGKSGLLLDLAQDGLLETYAPNCWAYLRSHPDTLASVTNPDGTIYGLPQVNSGAELRVSRKLFINKNWLSNVGGTVPTTTEELYELLCAFAREDANGNGNPDDEIPFCPMDWASVQDALFGAFGLANRGVHNQTVDCDPETGRVRLIAASDGYRSYLEYLRRLYAEGLMDNSVFTITDEQWKNNIANDRVGVFANTNLAWLPADQADDWVGVGEALEGPNGDKLWTAIRANFHSTGAAAVPATCADPALALRWLDYFWTDAGTLFYHMGVEGQTFEAGADGTFDYLPSVYEEIVSGNRTFDDVVAAISPYPGGSNPTVEIAPYFMGGEMADVPAQTARALFEYGPDEYWPSFTYTAEETEALSAVRADLSKWIDAARIEFITGVRTFEEWDDYLARLEQLRAPELLAVYQAAADRYHALSVSLN